MDKRIVGVAIYFLTPARVQRLFLTQKISYLCLFSNGYTSFGILNLVVFDELYSFVDLISFVYVLYVIVHILTSDLLVLNIYLLL